MEWFILPLRPLNEGKLEDKCLSKYFCDLLFFGLIYYKLVKRIIFL